jgi:hypothetical protein
VPSNISESTSLTTIEVFVFVILAMSAAFEDLLGAIACSRQFLHIVPGLLGLSFRGGDCPRQLDLTCVLDGGKEIYPLGSYEASAQPTDMTLRSLYDYVGADPLSLLGVARSEGSWVIFACPRCGLNTGGRHEGLTVGYWTEDCER